MFLTFEPFKAAAQLTPNATAWATVEYMTVSPVFVVTILHPIDGKNNILMMVSDLHLENFLLSNQKDAVKAVHVLFPPAWSPTSDWHIARVIRIERREPTGLGHIPSVLTTLADGKQYTGFPMTPAEGPTGRLTPLAEFGDSP